MRAKIAVAIAVAGVLTGCATMPLGPSAAVLPAPGKPFDMFAQEDAQCRAYAKQQAGADTDELAQRQVVGGAAAGAVLGAATGALLSGGDARGMQGGAGAGLLIGSMAGADAAGRGGRTLQQRYDVAYQQCMYANGNQVGDYAQPYTAPPPPPPPVGR